MYVCYMTLVWAIMMYEYHIHQYTAVIYLGSRYTGSQICGYSTSIHMWLTLFYYILWYTWLVYVQLYMYLLNIISKGVYFIDFCLDVRIAIGIQEVILVVLVVILLLVLGECFGQSGWVSTQGHYFEDDMQRSLCGLFLYSSNISVDSHIIWFSTPWQLSDKSYE